MTASPAPAPARPDRSGPPGLTPLTLASGFLPWIVFSVIAQRLAADGVAWAALLATAMAAVAVLRDRRRHGPQILGLASLVLFAVIAATGFVGGPGVDRWLFEWGRPLVGVVLGLYLLLTVPVLPFTAEYARQTTPREYWGSPTFTKINRVLSTAWALAITAMGAASLLTTALGVDATGTSGTHLLELLLDWVVPVVVIWAMVRFTATYPDRATGAATGSAR
jgi:energy-coupling factor transporter transmembrane protein EcfT